MLHLLLSDDRTLSIVERTLLAAGLVDEEAASASIDLIGRGDFRDGPMRMVTNPESGLAAAVPFDGWIQALWYRRDLFEQNALEAPVTWEQINVVCDVFGGGVTA